jgi:hypothetical protein
MEFEPMHFLLNIMTFLRTVWQNFLFGDQIKPLEILILIYPNQAENIVLYFLYSGY